MITPRILWVVILMAGTSLSACGSEEDAGPLPADPFVGRTTAEAPGDRFGKGFGAASRANPNSEPVKVSDGDIRPVSLTEEPLDVH